MDTEDAHEMYGVGRLSGLIQNPVRPHLSGQDAGPVEGCAHPEVAQGRLAGVVGGLAGDQKVRVASDRPAPMAFLQPLRQQAQGERVEVDGVLEEASWHAQAVDVEVEVVNTDPDDLRRSNTVDGD
ncbi:hypothetical protein ACFVZ8_31835 [Streptomyces sp. NPDC059558]|uniref:hypothetical protein n=1 Tax=unclassified Streptomyces TaxID=2593676 RepID=UPI0036B623E3